jgi:threonine dehydrogenase-like Zn-dependent dehydrogenase
MVLTGHGGPDKLVYRSDLGVPAPIANEVLMANEVLIEVTACGVNNTDIWTREGAYGAEDDPDAVASFQREESTLTFPRILRSGHCRPRRRGRSGRVEGQDRRARIGGLQHLQW